MIRDLLARFRQPAVDLTAEYQARLESLKPKISTACNADLASGRIVVVDVETTGLSLADDHLIAIGAVAINSGRIAVADSFAVVLRQEVESGKANILVHGIGGSAQRAGLPPEEALLAFLDYLDSAPLFAFHVAFDETMLRKACKQFLGIEFRHTWADLAYLMPELFPDYANKYHALDDWLAHFSIGNDARHNALADALATAQLGLIALRAAKARRATDFKALQSMEKAQRWLSAAR
ncbi:MAG: 3'-5' exonuclease [Gallionella sp.]